MGKKNGRSSHSRFGEFCDWIYFSLRNTFFNLIRLYVLTLHKVIQKREISVNKTHNIHHPHHPSSYVSQFSKRSLPSTCSLRHTLKERSAAHGVQRCGSRVYAGILKLYLIPFKTFFKDPFRTF